MTDELKELDTQIGKRHLVIEWDIDSGELSFEEAGWQSWQLAGVAAWLEAVAMADLSGDE